MLLTAAAAAVALGVLGVADLRRQASAGIWWGPGNTVIRVFDGSPAEAAGIRLGDRVHSIDGIPIEDTRQRVRRPRVEIGETRVYEIERDGERIEIPITYGPLLPRMLVLSLGDAATGACFLLFGLWAYFKAPSTATRLLALVGVCFGIPLLPAPWFDSFAVRAAAEAIGTTLIVFAFAFLLHFVLAFPYARSWLERPISRPVIYAPATLLALVFLYLIGFQPDATHGLQTFVSTFANLVLAGYFGASAWIMVSSFRQTHPDERNGRGISFMLLGTLLGMLPLAVAAFLRVVFPQFLLPGIEFYSLTLVLVPISFALAAVKSPPSPTPA